MGQPSILRIRRQSVKKTNPQERMVREIEKEQYNVVSSKMKGFKTVLKRIRERSLLSNNRKF